MSSIAENLQVVHENIHLAATACQRKPSDIHLLAVSKTFSTTAILKAIQAGQTRFGENYLQEALEKIADVKHQTPSIPIEWHFIGPIQSNKTRLIAENFDWVHTVDREKIAMRLAEQRPSHLPALNICIQVNISAEPSKSGVMPTDALALAQQIIQLPHVRLRGLMAIPEATDNIIEQRQAFAQLRTLSEHLQTNGIALNTLSMGMSGDMAAAITEGSTMVRIGSAIFGKRHYDHDNH
jgi:PLP dependent protein